MTAIDERRLSASLRLLVAASRQLSLSLDYPQTVSAVADLVVPEFADGFAVEVDEGDGRDGRTTVVSRGHLGTGARQLPLFARGRRLGTLRIAGGRADASELDPWEELALRIGFAIDAAQIYAREHHVADTLQRALLPERLPLDDRVAFDAAYLPGAEEAAVGGDWYDAFRLPDERIAFSVGDVAGHGLRAAIVMGEVRQAFRAAALNPTAPSHVLERANTIVNMRANPVMVTAVFGIVDPLNATVTYACAGHPPPLLALPCGTVTTLPKEGLPLGIVDDVAATDWTFSLPPGSMLALYTDGAIEYARDVVAGETRLLEAMRELVVDPTEQPARALLDGVFRGTENTDDVAVLTIAARDVASESFRFAFTAIPLAVPLVRRSLQRYAERLGLDEERRFALVTATGEAVANAVEHAYQGQPGLVRVAADVQDGTLVVSIEDEGKWKPAQRRDERGRGLPLMRALADAVEIRTHMTRTELRLTIVLPDRRVAV